MSKFFKTITVVILMSVFLAQASEARQVCANCYWKKPNCPTITPDEVVDMWLYNQNLDIVNPHDKGPFIHFACDNGNKTLGVEWTNETCDKIGGLSGIKDEDFPSIYDKPECQHGVPIDNNK
ncbi:MAG: hypothetical protein H0X26_01420 [Alphaproteobacteria bacterium]|nr:hypothetical protein [Alphaproteobacteria bacterium]